MLSPDLFIKTFLVIENIEARELGEKMSVPLHHYLPRFADFFSVSKSEQEFRDTLLDESDESIDVYFDRI